MFDCKICSQWCLTQYICNDCYIIKNSIRLFGRDKIINLIKEELKIKEEEKEEEEEEEVQKENQKKRLRTCSDTSNEFYIKKEDDKYHFKEVNNIMIKELKNKLKTP
jgi:hypothetical protein